MVDGINSGRGMQGVYNGFKSAIAGKDVSELPAVLEDYGIDTVEEIDALVAEGIISEEEAEAFKGLLNLNQSSQGDRNSEHFTIPGIETISYETDGELTYKKASGLPKVIRESGNANYFVDENNNLICKTYGYKGDNGHYYIRQEVKDSTTNKYTTVYYEFDENGNLIKRQVKDSNEVQLSQNGIDAYTEESPELTNILSAELGSDKNNATISFEYKNGKLITTTYNAKGEINEKKIFEKIDNEWKEQIVEDEHGYTYSGLLVAQEGTPENEFMQFISNPENTLLNGIEINEDTRYKYNEDTKSWTITSGNNVYTIKIKDGEYEQPILTKDSIGITEAGFKEENEALYELLIKLGMEINESTHFNFKDDDNSVLEIIFSDDRKVEYELIDNNKDDDIPYDKIQSTDGAIVYELKEEELHLVQDEDGKTLEGLESSLEERGKYVLKTIITAIKDGVNNLNNLPSDFNIETSARFNIDIDKKELTMVYTDSTGTKRTVLFYYDDAGNILYAEDKSYNKDATNEKQYISFGNDKIVEYKQNPTSANLEKILEDPNIPLELVVQLMSESEAVAINPNDWEALYDTMGNFVNKLEIPNNKEEKEKYIEQFIDFCEMYYKNAKIDDNDRRGYEIFKALINNNGAKVMEMIQNMTPEQLQYFNNIFFKNDEEGYDIYKVIMINIQQQNEEQAETDQLVTSFEFLGELDGTKVPDENIESDPLYNSIVNGGNGKKNKVHYILEQLQDNKTTVAKAYAMLRKFYPKGNGLDIDAIITDFRKSERFHLFKDNKVNVQEELGQFLAEVLSYPVNYQ